MLLFISPWVGVRERSSDTDEIGALVAKNEIGKFLPERGQDRIESDLMTVMHSWEKVLAKHLAGRLRRNDRCISASLRPMSASVSESPPSRVRPFARVATPQMSDPMRLCLKRQIAISRNQCQRRSRPEPAWEDLANSHVETGSSKRTQVETAGTLSVRPITNWSAKLKR